ncbi:MAG: hypothetical protein AAFR66_22255, partial [Bacteroidota bacterium]
PEGVRVSFYYGFSSEVGGGEYERESSFSLYENEVEPHMVGGVSLQEKLDELRLTGGVLEIQDNATYSETPVIRLGAGTILEIRAANQKRAYWQLNGPLLIEAEEGAELFLNGLIISGGPVVISQALRSCTIRHCTLVPNMEVVNIDELSPEILTNSKLVISSDETLVNIEKSIIGGIVFAEGARLVVDDSLIDGGAIESYSCTGTDDIGGILVTRNSTFIGRVKIRVMELASNGIFLATEQDPLNLEPPIWVERLQEGCARFSYFPPGSRVPRPYRCQPTNLQDAPRVRPILNSKEYGDPSYGQLSLHTADEIAKGSDDESEMGLFHHLYQPQRINNLQIRLSEYLRFGLEAGIFFES